MSVLAPYRKMPGYFAVPLAIFVSVLMAFALAALGVFILNSTLGRSKGPDDLGFGALGLLVALNVAIAKFIVLLSILINLHHQTSWLTPTLAFASCTVLVRLLGPFDIKFAPFMLGTGAAVLLISCWYLRTKEISSPEHVL